MKTPHLAIVAATLGGTLLLAIVHAKGPKLPESANQKSAVAAMESQPGDEKFEQVTLGSGCFWCTEAVFQQLQGVESAVSGYTGGHLANPTYEQICTGNTGHAEVIQVTYDPAKISFTDMLRVFWQTHDPTTPNRQGHDVGTQYRSAIFYHNDRQRKLAEEYKKQLDASGSFNAPVVTEIVPFERFYPAEKYHQEYYEQNPEQRYCEYVIRPKVEKFRQEFADLLDDAK